MSVVFSPTCDPNLSESWMVNDQDDDPCEIASGLLDQCTDNGAWVLQFLKPTLTYAPPSSQQANSCSCNTVSYSLISACATCQGGYFQSFTIWTENCPSDLIIRQNFPNRTKLSIDIPAYAYLPLTLDGLFDIKAASSSPSATPSMTSSATSWTTTLPSSWATTLPSSGATTLSTSSAFAAATSTSPTPVSKSQGTNTVEVAIVIIVSVTLVLGLLGWFVFLRFRRRRSPGYQPIASHRHHGPSISSVESEVTVVDTSASRQNWLMSFRNLRFVSNIWGRTPRVAPYSTEQMLRSGGTLEKVQPRVHRTINPATPPNQPSTSHRLPRPNRPSLSPVRTRTLPTSIQTMAGPSALLSSTFPEPSTSPDNEPCPHLAPEAVKHVPRSPGFRIEPTPTTPNAWPFRSMIVGSRPQRARHASTPEVQGSVSSLSTYETPWDAGDRDDDSDSMMLIPRSVDIVSTAEMGNSTLDRSGVDSSQPMGGSSNAPLSPAIASSGVVSILDSVRYGTPQARTLLFPAAVRAAGYTGVPPKDGS